MAHHDTGHQVTRAGAASGVLVTLVVAGAGVLALALCGSVGSVLTFVASLAVFVLPGVVVSRAWFAGTEKVLVGAVLGYLLSSWLASGLYRWGLFGPVPVAVANLGLTACVALARKRLAPETAREARVGWLAGAMLVALLLVSFPYLKVGAEMPEGVAYRAYFSADLMTHLSVVAELQKEAFPPQDPFYAGAPLGYYWLFFLFPALLGRWMGNQEALLLLYLAGDLLFVGLAYVVARRLVARPWQALLGVVVATTAASPEGLAVLCRSAWLGDPWGSFRDINVDAFSRWVFELTSIDGLHRSLLYTPQHLFSYSLLLILILLVLGGEPRRAGTSLLAGALLGGMAGTSIVTAMLAGPWLVGVRVRRGGPWVLMVRDLALIGLVSLGCLGWYFELGFFGGAGAALTLRRPQWLEIPALLAFDCGFLVLLASRGWRAKAVRSLGVLGLLSLLGVLFLDIRDYEGVWMAWRAGSVALVCLFLLATVGLQHWRTSVLVVVVLAGSWTAILDVYNAQDISNRHLSAGGFRWTTVVSPAEMRALQWVRDETPPSSVVQLDARARGPGQWALLPALAERRMAVGFPLFLLNERKYRVRERRHVRPIFTSGDAAEAYRLSRSAGIDYLFIGATELGVRGERLRPLWERPELFRKVYSNRVVSVFEVVR